MHAAIPARTLPELPSNGRVVQVRGTTWAVTDVREQGHPRSSADDSIRDTQHIVTLQALGEDNLGDELSVIWELEIGHTLTPDQGLPTRIDAGNFDDANTLGAYVDAVRWGAVTSADDNSYQAPFRSGATVEAYQLEPLRRALQSPRTNLLLADDVGLGKTIEAGLVIQELLLRHRARSVVVVCPPSLMIKWREEMRDKFGLDFKIVNSDLMAELRRSHGLNANPFRLFPRVIVSMAWLPSARAQRLLRDVYAEVGAKNSARRYAFDVLVVDEAHHVAPSSPATNPNGRGYAVDSQRTTSTRALADRCEHRLFLSATPHNGYSESFTALLAMIDDRRFERGATLSRDALKDVTVRRLKTEVTGKNFPPRKIATLAFTPDVAERQAWASLSDILVRSRDMQGPDKRGGDLVGMALRKRFLSSPLSFSRTLASYWANSSHTSAPLDDDDEVLRATFGSEQADEEEGLIAQPEFSALRRHSAAQSLAAATTEQVQRLISWGLKFDGKPDARLKALLHFLDAVCRPDATWSNERVVVFTEYVDTLEWLRTVLESKGYKGRVEAITGSTTLEERDLIRSRFTAGPATEPVRVLLATDSAGEGIDLQDHCHRLVNYDIPFNPSRLEQRIGRIDRYGQTQTPEIYHFSPTNHTDGLANDYDFLARIARKVAEVAQDLGSVNQVIDFDLQQRFAPTLRPRTAPVSHRTARAAAIINETLAGDRELNRRLTDLQQSFDATRLRMHLTPDNTERVVSTALALTNQPELRLVGSTDTDARVFEVPELARPWMASVEGLTPKLDSELLRTPRYPITFDADAAGGFDHTVHIHLGHPFLQRSARLLRNALVTGGGGLQRVTGVALDDLDYPTVAAVSRLVLVGQGGRRLHEEVFVTGIRVGAQNVAEEKVEQLLDRALDAGEHQTLPTAERERMVADWNTADSLLRHRLERAVTSRATARQQRVATQLADRQAADLARARQIFREFRGTLTGSITALRERLTTDAPMLDGFEQFDQLAQLRRDLRNLEDRLASLGDEEAAELATVEQRYTDIKPYVSQVALVFAVPTAQGADTEAIVQ